MKMKTTELINEETKKPYVAEDGRVLVENKFELGDTFIPKNNSVHVKVKNDVKKKDGSVIKKLEEFSIVAFVKDKDGKDVEVNGSKEIYVSLTPTQADSLKKKLNEGLSINQKVFEIREYESAKYGTQLGIFLKGKQIAPITWDEVDAEE